MTRLEIRDITAGYAGRTAVADVSSTVGSGDWLAIIGPNGAGKSTLLKSIAGLVHHHGQVLADDTEIGSWEPRRRARLIGYSPQTPTFPEGLTVTDYVLLGRTPHLGPMAREGLHDLEVVREVLDRLDLADLAGRRLTTLSGGERQRTVLARVFAQRAGLLLLDEPTTGLDVGHAQALLELVDHLRRESGTTVVSTLHDLTLAGQYAEHLLLLHDGRPVAQGDAAEVLTAERLSRFYSAQVTVLHAPDGSPVVTPVRRTR